MKRIVSVLLCTISIFVFVCGCEFSPARFFEQIFPRENTSVSIDSIDAKTLTPAKIDTADKTLCYNTLSKDQQKIYATLLTAANDMVKGWIKLPVSTKYFEADIMTAVYAIEGDHPEIFWLDTTHLVKQINSGEESAVYFAFEAKNDTDSCAYLFSKKERDEMSKRLEQKIEEIAKEMEFLGRFDKELYINDYLCNNIVYTEDDGSNLCYTAYGALIDGKAVCSGYAKAAQLLLKKAGIENVLCYGISKEENHVWNMVKLDDEWYHLDITWNDDDQNDFHTYEYFNVTSDRIKEDHTIFEMYSNIPISEVKVPDSYNFFDSQADAERYNYYEYNFLELNGNNYEALAKSVYHDFMSGNEYTQFIVYDQKQLEGFKSKAQTSVTSLLYAIYKLNYADSKEIMIKEYCVVDNIVLLFWR